MTDPFLEWQLGGFLQSWPKAWALAFLTALALAGTVLIVLSYFRTLRPLPSSSRAILIALRVLLLLAFLLCLANPSRIEKTPLEGQGDRPLTVLVDRSASMEQADNRNETRLQHALREWDRLREMLGDGGGSFRFFRFSDSMQSASSMEQAAHAGSTGEETHLYDSLQKLLQPDSARAPGAIVCLTDGIDTSSELSGPLMAQALEKGTPLYFIVGKNRSRPVAGLSIRELQAPPVVLRRSKFQLGLVAEGMAEAAGNIPVTLYRGDEILQTQTLLFRKGLNLVPFFFSLTSEEPGPLNLRVVLGQGTAADEAGTTIQVVGKQPVRILFYQGALQWGYSFFINALRTDPSFTVDTILNPALRVKTLVRSGESMPSDLPAKASDLKPYDILVLAHVYADQISREQQQAILDYTRAGGGVLFVTPDNASSKMLAGSLLEEMLPVIFEDPNAKPEEGEEARSFQDKMRALGGAQSSEETIFAIQAQVKTDIAPLHPFVVPPGASTSTVAAAFRADKKEDQPQFTDSTRLRGVKPGAEILALNPDASPSGAPRALLVRQTFGRGTVTAMATDMLWRWKLSLPSESRLAETFWQQTILALAQSTGEGLRFIKPQFSVPAGQSSLLELEGSQEAPVRITTTSPAGTRRDLPAEWNTEQSLWNVRFAPDTTGRWKIEATDARGYATSIRVEAAEQLRNRERSNLPPDEEGLRLLAEATGGAVLNDASSFRLPSTFSSPLFSRQTQPLWNQGWILFFCLGLYVAELLYRRSRKML